MKFNDLLFRDNVRVLERLPVCDRINVLLQVSLFVRLCLNMSVKWLRMQRCVRLSLRVHSCPTSVTGTFRDMHYCFAD